MHLEIISGNTIHEKIRPLLAWNLSRRLCSDVLKWLEKYPLEIQVGNLEVSLVDNLSNFQGELQLRHLFYDTAPLWSSTKFQTLYGTNPFAWALMAALSPDYLSSADETSTPFTGTVKPTKALSGDVIEMIINTIIDPIISLKEEILFDAKLLWSVPLGRSTTQFLENYHDSAFEFLGEGIIEKIRTAQGLSDSELQDQHLEESILTSIEEKEGKTTWFLLNILNSIIYTRNNEHPALIALLKHENLLKSLQDLGTIWAVRTIDIFLRIYLRLRCAGKDTIADTIAECLKKLDISGFSDESIQIIIRGIGFIALIGNEITLIKKLVDASKTNKTAREALGYFKFTIENIFSDIPPSFRDRAKMILIEIADIPSLERKEGDKPDE